MRFFFSNKYKRFFILLLSLALFSCEKEDYKVPAPSKPDPSFVEEFDLVQDAIKRGWVMTNNSSPVGATTWFQGVTAVFSAPFSTLDGTSYVAANFNSTAQLGGTISNWLISPSVEIKGGDVIEFWTRNPSNVRADRLQVRLNAINDSYDVGSGATAFGNFSIIMLDINADYGISYPSEWTKYTVTIPGIAARGKRRFAFRYFVEDAGLAGLRSNFIGIDRVEFISKQ